MNLRWILSISTLENYKIMSIELKDWLNSINFNKENLMEDPDAKKDYSPYIINRCLSGNLDCIMFVNEMNKYSFL